MGDEITSIMVVGNNLEYDGLDLIELLSEEFEVCDAAPDLHLFRVTCPVIPRLQPAYERIIRALRGCSGTQVVLALLRAGHAIGHVCLIRDGSFEDAAELRLL